MSDLQIIMLILSLPFFFGFFIYLLHVSSHDNTEAFWESKSRYIILMFLPIILLLGVFGVGSMSPPDFYYSLNKKRAIETIVFTTIGFIIGFYIAIEFSVYARF